MDGWAILFWIFFVRYLRVGATLLSFALAGSGKPMAAVHREYRNQNLNHHGTG